MTALKHLFNPIRVGQMEVKNRLVMPPMGINFGVDANGCVTAQLWEYFRARAKGGTGMIVVGGAAVHPTGLDLPYLPRIWDDTFIPALQKMTAIMRPYETNFGIQLLHGGRQAFLGDKVAPSPIPALGVVKGIPRELSLSEIGEIVQSFGAAARRAQKCGFDFVEIHAAHGYLITEFLAPNSNQRGDHYGGAFENRIRFLLEVLREIKAQTGSSYPVGVRFNGDDYIPNGWTLAETCRLAPILEENGADYLHITAGIYGSFPISVPSMYAEQGCFVQMAEAVKKTVSIPVIAVGRIKDPAMADRMIGAGQADMVSMGRAHIADPEIARKAKTGNSADIRPCIGCCLGCIERALRLEASTCVMNPEVGREHLRHREPDLAEILKNILVIGAGPAGLAFASVAAHRGHTLTICEEEEVAGGLLRYASIPPGRSELKELVDYYLRQLVNLGVDIRYNVKVDETLIRSLTPDAIIIATGSRPEIPQIENLCETEMALHTILDVLADHTQLKDRVLILGGNVSGLVTADYLAEKGKEVIVMHRQGHFASEMAGNDRTYLRERLKHSNVRLYKNVGQVKILHAGVKFMSADTEVILEGIDDLVISEGLRSVREVANLVRGANIPIHFIGDAKRPGNLLDSQAEADELARSI